MLLLKALAIVVLISQHLLLCGKLQLSLIVGNLQGSHSGLESLGGYGHGIRLRAALALHYALHVVNSCHVDSV